MSLHRLILDRGVITKTFIRAMDWVILQLKLYSTDRFVCACRQVAIINHCLVLASFLIYLLHDQYHELIFQGLFQNLKFSIQCCQTFALITTYCS